MRKPIFTNFMILAFLALAGPLPAGAAWQPPELIDAGAGIHADRPQIAFNDAGNAIAVWSDGSNQRIYANRWDGTAWGTPELIDADAGYYVGSPQIAFDGAGNAIAVWRKHYDSSYRIYANHWDGADWGTAELIDAGAGNDAGSPQIAFDGAGNAIAVWWQSDGSNNRIYANRWNGTTWGTAELIDAGAGNPAGSPQIAFDGAGNAIAVWRQSDGPNYHIYANRWDGTAWGTAEIIDAGAGNYASQSQIAFDGAGNAIAVWNQHDGSNNRIYANRWNGTTWGTTWGTAELIDAGGGSNEWTLPQIAFDGAGNAIAVWTQWVGLNKRIYANRWDGADWGTAELIDAGAGNSAGGPQIAFDGAGDAIAIWSQHDGSNRRIYAALYSPQVSHTVTPSAGTNGIIDPATEQTVNDGDTTQFTVTPITNYTASVGGTCGGSLVGDTYTTDAITDDCSVVATFAPLHEDDTATGSGTATASTTVSGNSETACEVSSSGFVPAPVAPPPGVTLPHGMYAFTVENCTPGFSVNMVIEYPDPIPAGAEYWKYDADAGWYTLPATISGNQVSFTVTDGDAGDHTGAQNGTITDPGGIGIQSTHAPGTATPIPTLSEWAMILLSLLLGGMAFVMMRRRV